VPESHHAPAPPRGGHGHDALGDQPLERLVGRPVQDRKRVGRHPRLQEGGGHEVRYWRHARVGEQEDRPPPQELAHHR